MTASRLLAAALSLTAVVAQAHEGHGLPGSSHWHAGDIASWIALALIVALAFAWGRRQ